MTWQNVRNQINLQHKMVIALSLQTSLCIRFLSTIPCFITASLIKLLDFIPSSNLGFSMSGWGRNCLIIYRDTQSWGANMVSCGPPLFWRMDEGLDAVYYNFFTKFTHHHCHDELLRFIVPFMILVSVLHVLDKSWIDLAH